MTAPDLNDYDDLDDDDAADGQDTNAPESDLVKRLRRQLTKAARERDSALADRDSARQAIAIGKAGLPELNERQTKALLSSVEGEVTAESLKAAATDLGWITETVSDEQVAANASASAQREISQAVSGALPGGATPNRDEQADQHLSDGRVLDAIRARTNHPGLIHS